MGNKSVGYRRAARRQCPPAVTFTPWRGQRTSSNLHGTVGSVPPLGIDGMPPRPRLAPQQGTCAAAASGPRGPRAPRPQPGQHVLPEMEVGDQTERHRPHAARTFPALGHHPETALSFLSPASPPRRFRFSGAREEKPRAPPPTSSGARTKPPPGRGSRAGRSEAVAVA